jgi:MYXO-CTERM domain-containing protein
MRLNGISMLLALALTSGAAMAQTGLASFSYDSLAGGYTATSPTTGVFNATAVNTVALKTVGDFNRTVATTGNADFPAGFVADPNLADIAITMNVNVTGGGLATGGGTISITDTDGDVFSADINGTWFDIAPGFYFFNGDLTNIVLTDNGVADGAFNGYNGSWLMNLPGNPLTGAIVNLVFGTSNPGFFVNNFNDFAVGVSGQVVPTPGVLALVGLGGLAAARRRR